MSDRRALYVFSALAAEQVADVLSTKQALSHGGYEANPAAAPYVHLSVPLLLCIKLVLPAVGFLLWRWVASRRATPVPTAMFLPYLPVIGYYAYVITKNLSI